MTALTETNHFSIDGIKTNGRILLYKSEEKVKDK